MHHGTCVTHVPWCISGSLTCGDGENVPGIPGACAAAILRIWQEAHGMQQKKNTQDTPQDMEIIISNSLCEIPDLSCSMGNPNLPSMSYLYNVADSVLAIIADCLRSLGINNVRDEYFSNRIYTIAILNSFRAENCRQRQIPVCNQKHISEATQGTRKIFNSLRPSDTYMR